MPNYDFHTLSPIEFERLSRDLIQARDDIFLESFSPGKDQGIDALTDKDREEELIVQCKRYVDSNYSQLKSKIKNKESDKIEDLEPSEYILTTAQSLSVEDKEELEKIISDAGAGSVEILGQEDINNLLGLHPDIERQHFKLWLHSSENLQAIINNDVFRASEIEENQIRDRLKLYVRPECFYDAKEIIDENNFCIIAGNPGIGKTTLAEQLIINYILEEDYELIKINNDISEAFRVDRNSDSKVIYYYDDFLGKSSVVEKLNKNEESRLINLINMVRNSEDKKMILTTREYILNQAEMTYERLDNENLENIFVIEMGEYSRKERAEILFNHIFWTELDEELTEQIVNDSNYFEIIDHENFNPRIVEHMTLKLQDIRDESKNYIEDFLFNLKNPENIWDHAFHRQLSTKSKAILFLLTSLPLPVAQSDLKKVFENYCFTTGNTSSHEKTRIYRDSLKELSGNFIETFHSKTGHILLEFHNPSIRDYLMHEIESDPEILKDILDNVVYFDQLEIILRYNGEYAVRDDYSPDFSDFLKSETNVIFDKLLELFEKESCRFRKVNLKRGGTKYRRKLQNSNKRLSFIVDKYDNYKEDLPHDCLDDFIKLFKEIFDAECEKNVLRKHSMLSKFFEKESIDTAAFKEILEMQVRHLIWICNNHYYHNPRGFFEEMYEIWCDFDDFLNDDLQQDLEVSFRTGVEDEWRHLSESNEPGWIEQYADDLSHYSEELGLQFETRYEKAMQRAQEMHAKRDRMKEKATERRKANKSSGELSDEDVTTTQKINKMFNKL